MIRYLLILALSVLAAAPAEARSKSIWELERQTRDIDRQLEDMRLAQLGGFLYAPPAGSACTGPLDIRSTNIHTAYGLRKLKSSYAGHLINVSLSGTATDIDPVVGGCDIDTTLLSGCTSVGTCPVNTWYDQGLTINATQTGSNRPSLLINIQNGHPTVRGTAASSTSINAVDTTFSTTLQNTTIIMVGSVRAAATNTRLWAYSLASPNQDFTSGMLLFNDSTPKQASGQTAKQGGTFTSVEWTSNLSGTGFHVISDWAIGTTPCIGISVDQATAVTGACSAPTDVVNTRNLWLFSGNSSGTPPDSFSDTDISEFLSYADDDSASGTRGPIEANQKSWWGTP